MSKYVCYDIKEKKDLQFESAFNRFVLGRRNSVRKESLAFLTRDIVRIIDYLYGDDDTDIIKNAIEKGIKIITKTPQDGFNIMKINKLVEQKGYELHFAIESDNENAFTNICGNVYYDANKIKSAKDIDPKFKPILELSLFANLCLYGENPIGDSKGIRTIYQFYKRYCDGKKYTTKMTKAIIDPLLFIDVSPEFITNIDSSLFAISIASYTKTFKVRARAYITKNGIPVLYSDDDYRWVSKSKDFVENIINNCDDIDLKTINVNSKKSIYDIISMNTEKLSIIDKLIVAGLRNYIKFLINGIESRSLNIDLQYLESVLRTNYNELLINDFPFERLFRDSDKMVGIKPKNIIKKLYLLKEKYGIDYNISNHDLYTHRIKNIKKISNAIFNKEKINMLGTDIAFNSFLVEDFSRMSPGFTRKAIEKFSMLTTPIYSFHRDIFEFMYKCSNRLDNYNDKRSRKGKFSLVNVLSIFAASGYMIDFEIKNKKDLIDKINYAVTIGRFNIKTTADNIDFNGDESDLDKIDIDSIINYIKSKIDCFNFESDINHNQDINYIPEYIDDEMEEEIDSDEYNDENNNHLELESISSSKEDKYAIILPLNKEIVNRLKDILPNYEIAIVKPKKSNAVKEELKTDFNKLFNLFNSSKESEDYKDYAIKNFCKKWIDKV